MSALGEPTAFTPGMGTPTVAAHGSAARFDSIVPSALTAYDVMSLFGMTTDAVRIPLTRPAAGGRPGAVRSD
ncbi:hypothetical protein AB0I60_03160 [Actinosynnema sp. NPDC050436]|uniref:hypothetical protein n=1 Tax=Actinosynnema sp. NPDC050436 TaxID=3155659 RepID=UPI0033E87987